MKHALAPLLLLAHVLGLGAAFPQTRLQPPLPAEINSEQAGQALAENLRNSVPEENTQFEAILKTRSRDGQIRRVPLSCQVVVGPDHWQTTYTTQAADPIPAETLVIRHRRGQPNEYHFAQGGPTQPAPASPSPLGLDKAAQPLAGSDFWLVDLGMDFLHWPGQRLIKTEMRKSRWCHVLESTNLASGAAGYSRVLSWLDKEKGQPLLAEAYDQQNQLLKEFSIGSIKKVNGKWQVQDMKITNLRTRSRTWLEFDLTQE